MRLPLAGLRVVDMADEKAELCGRVLADLGAEVIRVEPPGGAVSRTLPPFHAGTSLYFEVRNAGKTGVTLDLAEEEGRAGLLAMLERADIWIETTRPGELGLLDLDPREVSARLPNLVVVSVTDFGQTGPYRDFVATDAVMEAMSWMLFRAGVPELPPVLPPGPFAYDMVGASAAFAALTAYLDRCEHRTRAVHRHERHGGGGPDDRLGPRQLQRHPEVRIYGEVRDGGERSIRFVPCKRRVRARGDGDRRPSCASSGHGLASRDARPGQAEILHQEYWEEQGAYRAI